MLEKVYCVGDKVEVKANLPLTLANTKVESITGIISEKFFDHDCGQWKYVVHFDDPNNYMVICATYYSYEIEEINKCSPYEEGIIFAKAFCPGKSLDYLEGVAAEIYTVISYIRKHSIMD